MSENNETREDVTQSMSNTLAADTARGMQAANHDQNTIHQQNNSQQNEIIQTLIETRRQTVAEFEQRMRQQDQMFQNTMQMMLQNQEAAAARASALQQQAQVQNHSQAMQEQADKVAMHYVNQGIVTIIP